MKQFDLCVIGAGSAGFAAAQRARELGKTVAIVEGERALAGLCILRGCMPAKTVLHSAKVAETIEHAPEVGVDAASVRVEPAAIVQRKRRIVREFAKDRIEEIKQFPLFRGDGRFIDGSTLDVSGTKLSAERFLLSTGSIVEKPPAGVFGQRPLLTTDDALEMTDLPRAITVFGGGPVGCEFAQYFARLGVSVTLVQDAPELLRNEDEDVGRAVREGLSRDGVRIAVDVPLEQAAAKGSGPILFASGRRPNICDFALGNAGVEYSRNGIVVDATLRTANPRIYAAGDVIGRRMLVHVAVHCGRIAAENAFADSPAEVDFDLYEAHGVYSQPEVAVAGLTEREAKKRGLPYRTAQHEFSDHGRAITENELQGFVKLLADESGKILGVTIVGESAGELLQDALTLLYFRANVGDIARIPHLHPTLAEILTFPAEELSARR